MGWRKQLFTSPRFVGGKWKTQVFHLIAIKFREEDQVCISVTKHKSIFCDIRLRFLLCFTEKLNFTFGIYIPGLLHFAKSLGVCVFVQKTHLFVYFAAQVHKIIQQIIATKM